MSDESELPSENEVAEGEEVQPSNIGRIEWVDLTVGDAARLRDFYKAVIGWKSENVDMGSYTDFNMKMPETGDTIAGVCHARGSNANLPNQWLIYVRVASVKDSVAECERRGGKVLDGPRRLAGQHFAVIEDPAGAVLSIMSN